VVRKHNKPRPRVEHRGIARFLEIYQKIESRRPMVTPHLPWKFYANPSSRFLVILLTKKQINKEIDRKQYPVPLFRGGGVNFHPTTKLLMAIVKEHELSWMMPWERCWWLSSGSIHCYVTRPSVYSEAVMPQIAGAERKYLHNSISNAGDFAFINRFLRQPCTQLPNASYSDKKSIITRIHTQQRAPPQNSWVQVSTNCEIVSRFKFQRILNNLILWPGNGSPSATSVVVVVGVVVIRFSK